MASALFPAHESMVSHTIYSKEEVSPEYDNNEMKKGVA